MRDFLLQRSQSISPNAVANLNWLQQFLGSDMMTHLSQTQWQHLVASFQPQVVVAGDYVLRHGDMGHACFVIEEGHAIVQRDQVTVAHLGPGDFFGEEALITGQRRSADVTALQDMKIHAVAHDAFEKYLLQILVEFVPYPNLGVRLNVGQNSISGCLPVDLRTLREQTNKFDPQQSYYITGGPKAHRALGAFLLIQRGIRAYPLLDEELAGA